MPSEDRIAIVHDSSAQHAESENVVGEMVKMLPQADLLPAVHVAADPSHNIRPRFWGTSRGNRLPAKERFSESNAVLRPFAIRRLDLSDYSIVISNSLGFAGGAVCPDEAIHVCYYHGPARAHWRYKGPAQTGRTNIVAELLLKPLLAGLAKIDAESSLQPDYCIAKSQLVADEIKRCYGRYALVIHPPIDISRYYQSGTVEDYFLIVSPLLPHKRIDMVIAACNSTGERLLIVGEGPDKQRLEKLAGPTVELLGGRTERETAELLARSEAVFCPDVEEDFDTMPLKANASGRPAISFAAGSALETIDDGESGVLYREYSRPAIVDAMKRCSALDWDADSLRVYSKEFDVSAFRRRFTTMLEDILGTQALRRAIA